MFRYVFDPVGFAADVAQVSSLVRHRVGQPVLNEHRLGDLRLASIAEPVAGVFLPNVILDL